jgi:hypothetical protein
MMNEEKAGRIGLLRLEDVKFLVQRDTPYDEAKKMAIPIYEQIKILPRRTDRIAISLFLLMVELIELYNEGELDL